MIAKMTPTEMEREFVPELTPEEEDHFYAMLDLDEEGLKEEEIQKRKTKIFVGGLKFSSEDEVLNEYFKRFGEIKEAVVIRDRKTGLSKGYGFVTMHEFKCAIRAISDKSPKLDGRRCNVNLAYIGQKKNGFSPSRRSFFHPHYNPEYSPVMSPQFINPYTGMPVPTPTQLVTSNGQILYMAPGGGLAQGGEPMYIQAPHHPGPMYEEVLYNPNSPMVMQQPIFLSNQNGQFVPSGSMSPPCQGIMQPQMIDYNNNLPGDVSCVTVSGTPSPDHVACPEGSPGPQLQQAQPVAVSHPAGPHFINGMVVNGNQYTAFGSPPGAMEQIVVGGKPVMVSMAPQQHRRSLEHGGGGGNATNIIEVITTGSGAETPSDASSLSPSGQPPQGQVNVLTSHVINRAPMSFADGGHVVTQMPGGPGGSGMNSVAHLISTDNPMIANLNQQLIQNGHAQWNGGPIVTSTTYVQGSPVSSSPPPMIGADGCHVISDGKQQLFQYQPMTGPRMVPQYATCK